MSANNNKWWLRVESNHRHRDFQSLALPTELQSQKKWRSRRGLDPRSSAWQADVVTTALRDHFGCGRRIWTYDLWVMSPTSYRTALSRDKKYWRRKRDSNPCAACTTSRFSRPIPSTGLGYSSKKKWCLRSDLNRHEFWCSQDFLTTIVFTTTKVFVVRTFSLP